MLELQQFDLRMVIFILIGVVVGGFVAWVYFRSTPMVKILGDLLGLIIKAEQIYNSGEGSLKKDFVIQEFLKIAPKSVRVFLTPLIVDKIVEVLFQAIKGLLTLAIEKQKEKDSKGLSEPKN